MMPQEGKPSAPKWAFITNHGAVLAIIAKNESVTAREMALRLGVTEGSVLRIIKDLEDSGYLKRMKDGRKNSYELNGDLPLPLPENRMIAVGDLLRVLNGPSEPETPD